MRYVKRSISLGLLILIGAFCFWYFDVQQYIPLEELRLFAQDHGVLGPILFVLAYAVATITFLPILPLAVIGGLVFGLMLGSVYVTIGASIGAIASFYIARRYGKKAVEKITRNKLHKIHQYDEKIRQNGFLTVLSIRIIPFLLFKGPNYILGLTKVRSRDYIAGTIIGIIPESVVFVYVGNSFFSLSWQTVLWGILLIVAVLGLGWWGKVLLSKNKQRKIALEK